jgi:hypothetical protein
LADLQLFVLQKASANVHESHTKAPGAESGDFCYYKQVLEG